MPRKNWNFVHLRIAPAISRGGTRQVESEVSDVEKRRLIEAVLLISPQGLTSRRVAKLTGLADATEVRTLIRQLNLLYDSRGKPYRVEEVAGGYAIVTRSQFAPWLRKLSYMPGELRLGQSTLEALAIVAYRQPVTRADIEAIRGVSCSEVLKQLMEMDLVRISGRSEDLGRPYLYSITQRFLQMFGLRSADRLPRIQWVNTIPPSELTTVEDLEAESDVKESTVKKSITATALLSQEIVDERLSVNAAEFKNSVVRSARDDDEDEFFDDDDEDDDDDEEDDFEEWEEDEELDEESDEEDGEDLEEEDEEEEEWEEVDDEDDEEEELEEDDDDWDDDEDDDWDDDEEEEDEDWE